VDTAGRKHNMEMGFIRLPKLQSMEKRLLRRQKLLS